MQLSNNKILITGGASGIGLGLAERFIRENNTVIICGRRASAHREAAGKVPGLITYQFDLQEVIEIIPPALKTDVGGPGLHDSAPPVSDFITSIFEQLKNGSNEVSFGTSSDRARVNNETIAEYFSRLNPS